MQTKRCTKCKKLLPESEFYRKRLVSVHSWCKDCEKAYNKKYLKSPHGRNVREMWIAANPEKIRTYQNSANLRLRRQRRENPDRFKDYDLHKIGVTLAEKKIKFEIQGRRCAICKSRTPNTKHAWFADHNHRTEKFRGILCGRCNSVLGYAMDNIQVLKNAIWYLQESE